MNGIVTALLAALGPDVVKTGEAIPQRNRQDAGRASATLPLALLLPRSTTEVAAALRICHAHGQPVVPQGGMTGLVGGAHPESGEVALSLERMTGVEEIDREAGTLTALAGTPLQVIQDAAADAGFLCGIDLGARGSCSIGGNVATNAGGNQVLRYGMTRRNVLGLEAVLADGTVLSALTKMLKNNTGYDWVQLFVGSEGTLGVVTRVVIGLHPKPAGVETALVAVASVADSVALLRAAERALPRGLLAFEAMWADFIAVAVERLGLPPPFAAPQPLVLLIETPGDGSPAGRQALEEFLAGQLEKGTVRDALIAQSGQDRARFWAYRESPYEYGRILPALVGFDISIPIGRIGEAVQAIKGDLAARFPGLIQAWFGHVADSNLHLIATRDGIDAGLKHRVEEVVYGHVARFEGSISAEHGVGRSKRRFLPLSRSKAELTLMRAIKTALDPSGILNPGRILPNPMESRIEG
jgi:FAD/FMN-containing dehydrogenase